MSDSAVKFIVSGRVQGVFYRASTRDVASGLGLDGWAKNLADGRVEIIAAGPQAAVAEFCGWLWSGPPGAEVTSVTVEESEVSVAEGFSVR